VLKKNRTLALLLALASAAAAAELKWANGEAVEKPGKMTEAADWRGVLERRWAGPSIWCNRLQDWTVSGGALAAVAGKGLPLRAAHLLTYELGRKRQPFRLKVVVGTGEDSIREGFAGFLIGAGEGRLDYRGAAMIHHMPGKGGGILAVVETKPGGELRFLDMSAQSGAPGYPELTGQRRIEGIHREAGSGDQLLLHLEAVPTLAEAYDLRLSAWSHDGTRLLAAAELPGVPESKLRGNVALASHNNDRPVRHEFRSFQVDGGRLEHHPERAFGPIAGTLYSVSNATLKLTAQFMPLGQQSWFPVPEKTERMPGPPGAAPTAETAMRLLAHLEVKSSDSEWRTVDGPKPVTAPDFSVLFRVDGWDQSRPAETRVVFRDSAGINHYYTTHIRKDPVQQSATTVGAVVCTGVIGLAAQAGAPKPAAGQAAVGRWTPANVWMPFADSVQALKRRNVDLMFFLGDQVYEFKPTAKDWSMEPHEDYLYKWLLWVWSFRELTNHVPAILQTDDHDVYHGNLWGWGGRLNTTGFNGGGGYKRSPYFVNSVSRTQTGHLPDPYDPLPSESGITHYYTTFKWGGVGFAVLEDRKFKTPPQVRDPEKQVLLGERQERMLREWGQDWRDQKFKCVVSQTNYATIHVNPSGEIPADADSNGFPKSRRDVAVDLFRKAGAFLLSGDTHLASFAQVGVKDVNDGVPQFTIPALGNVFWRWFYPARPGANRTPGAPDYTGDFVDAWGNPFRVFAVANPEARQPLKENLTQRYLVTEEEARQGLGDSLRTSRSDGYGVVVFNKETGETTAECWRHDADPTRGDRQFQGWPVTIPGRRK
jgi:alkaline phosphatase D